MDLISIIKKIIFLPIEFSRSDNKSIHSLLQDTGYFNVYSEITECTIFQELSNHIECIESWLSWSEDKRASDGWYFLKKDNSKYIVGNISSNGKMNDNFELDNAVQACSVFIKREIESIRMS